MISCDLLPANYVQQDREGNIDIQPREAVNMPVIQEMPEESCRTVCNGDGCPPSSIRRVMPSGYFDVTATGRRGSGASLRAISGRSGPVTAMEMPRLRVSHDEICSRRLCPNVCHSGLTSSSFFRLPNGNRNICSPLPFMGIPGEGYTPQMFQPTPP